MDTAPAGSVSSITGTKRTRRGESTAALGVAGPSQLSPLVSEIFQHAERPKGIFENLIASHRKITFFVVCLCVFCAKIHISSCRHLIICICILKKKIYIYTFKKSSDHGREASATLPHGEEPRPPRLQQPTRTRWKKKRETRWPLQPSVSETQSRSCRPTRSA